MRACLSHKDCRGRVLREGVAAESVDVLTRCCGLKVDVHAFLGDLVDHEVLGVVGGRVGAVIRRGSQPGHGLTERGRYGVDSRELTGAARPGAGTGS